MKTETGSRIENRMNQENINKMRRGARKAFCLCCEMNVPLITFAEVAKLFSYSLREVTDMAELGIIHRIHNSKAEVMICKESADFAFATRQTMILNPNLLPRLH